MSIESKPLYWWNSFQLKSISQYAGDVLRIWHEEWGVIGDKYYSNSQKTISQVASEVASFGLNNNAVFHCLQKHVYYWSYSRSSDDQIDFNNDLTDLWMSYFEVEKNSIISSNLIKSLIEDFWLRIGALFNIQISDDSSSISFSNLSSQFRNWSGSVIVEMEILPKKYIALLLPSTIVVDFLKSHQLVQSQTYKNKHIDSSIVMDSLKTLQVKLHIQLNPVSVSLGDLNQMQVGDIFSVPHLLDEPLIVQKDDTPLTEVYLGKAGNYKAIELLDAVRLRN